MQNKNKQPTSLKFIFLHPDSKKEHYKGRVDWDIVISMVLLVGTRLRPRLTCMCFSRNFSASWTQGALSLGVRDFHFLPEKIRVRFPSLKVLKNKFHTEIILSEH